jgi:competence protein ComEA
MFFFTPHERRAVIFIAAVFFCGTCLSIFFKLKPSLYRHLDVLDEPLARPKININQATYEELLAVPGLGPSTAARIIYARQEKGHFDSLDDLRQVKRFSQKMLDRVRPHLTVGGK